ncbi:insulinase family protein [Candidatus Woesebacteria bacterium]|nr:insulinase family protein [Candidatus Woesebacteria bacterium]
MNTFKKIILANGLQVLVVPVPATESVTTMVLANTGSRYEQPREHGIAHFLEHMVFKGTTLYPDSQALASTIDAIGADFNAFTSKEYTGYYVKSASRHIEIALEVISDMLLQPLLKEEDLEREKGVIIEEINMYKDTPMQYVSNLFDQMMFDESGLGHDIVGGKETVSRFTPGDFRSFLQQWYGLRNLVLVLAGDERVLNDPATLATATRCFSKETSERPGDKINMETLLAKNKPLASHRLHLETRKTEQAHLILGWPGLKRTDKRRYVQTLLSIILGGNMSSRLFTEVREKRGLCYYVHSDVDTYHDIGVFGCSAGVDPERIDEALTVILEQFKGLANGKLPISQAELDRAKEYITGTMVLNLEESRSLAQFYGFKQLLDGEIKTPEQVLTHLRAVTLEDLHALAKNLVRDGAMRLAVIGPFKQKEKFEQFLI